MKWRLTLGTALALTMLSTSAMAEDGASMFVQKCGTCHAKGGQAAPVNPADKASIVWDKFFKRGRHKADFSQTVSVDDLQVIVQYLKDHAADSDQPAVAVIPR